MITFTQLSSKQKKLFVSSLLLTLAALFVTVLLIEAHYRVPESGTFCNLDSYWNCDIVNKSIFAQILGIPVSILGFGFYAFFAALLVSVWRGYDFTRLIRPIKIRHLMLFTAFFGTASAIVMAIYQSSFLTNLFWLPIIQQLLAIWGLFYFVKKSRREQSNFELFSLWITQMTFFGVNFAFYLSNIEFFILQAVCIYCFAQQILITINFIVLLNLLKANKKHFVQKIHV